MCPSGLKLSFRPIYNDNMNNMNRLWWPAGVIIVFLALFATVVLTGSFGDEAPRVRLGLDSLRVKWGSPMRAVRLPVGARVRKDVAYGAHRLQKLDVYIPPGVAPSEGPLADSSDGAPIVFMVHGGGWQRGDKASRDVVRNKINHFLPKGYIFISVNYRLSPEIDPTSQVEDVASALAFVQEHAADWGGDGERIVVMGHSAGAHLVTMLTSAPEIGQSVGVGPWLGTVALDSAAYNVVELMRNRHRSLYDRAFGRDPSYWALASPALRLQTAPPPMLLICSTLWAHSCQQAQAYADAVESFGGTITLERVVLRHDRVNRNVGVAGPLTDAVDAFMHSVGLD